MLRFATLEIWKDEPFVSVMVCYASCVIICIICVPAQLELMRNKFAIHYQRIDQREKQVGLSEAEDSTLEPMSPKDRPVEVVNTISTQRSLGS